MILNFFKKKHYKSPPLVEGFIDGVERRTVRGWAWQPENPHNRLIVQALLNGKVAGTAVADIARPDLAALGKGDGYYGFLIILDHPLVDLTSLVVRVHGKNSPALGFSSRQALDSENTDAIVESISTSPIYEGHIDFVSSNKISGWARKIDDPKDRVKVSICIDNIEVATVYCNKFRDDLLECGKGDGCYGFEFQINDDVFSGDGTLTLNVSGSDFYLNVQGETLQHSRILILQKTVESRRIQSIELNYEGYVDTLSRTEASGWVWCPSEPNREVEIECVIKDRIIGRAAANIFRADLLEHGKGTGLYGFVVKFDRYLVGEMIPTFRVANYKYTLLHNALNLPTITENLNVGIERSNVEGLVDDHRIFTNAGQLYEEFDDTIIRTAALDHEFTPPLVMAFYLPQFHSIKENDLYWGKGFTEWRQLSRALPRFPGHYQPRIPRDLGFYELGGASVLKKQAALAKAAGINAFCYYYYWFNGKKVLNKPIDSHIKSNVDMPFLIMWANENWTKTWDGMEDNILLRQDYDIKDEDALLRDLAWHLSDSRYVKIDGRPIFIIYNPKHIPDCKKTIERWRSKFRDQHKLSPLFFMAQTFETLDPIPFGFDGAIEFPPHKLAAPHPGRPVPDAYSSNFSGRVIDYDDFVATSLDEGLTDYPLIKTVVPSWDNDARRPGRGLILEKATPQKYESWISELIRRSFLYPVYDTPIVAINAWNEWAESAYLEPDVHYGAAFLNATARGIKSGVAASLINRRFEGTSIPVSVVLPCYNHARFLKERIASVIGQTVKPAEIIFLDDCSSDDSVELAEEMLAGCGIPFRIVRNAQNSGNVFKQWIKGISLASHDLIWIAETDDTADRRFLENIIPSFEKEDVLASFGHIRCINQFGEITRDLDNYYDGLRDFSWSFSRTIESQVAFSHDFSIKNIIPNASGLVFRKPIFSDNELKRLFEYTFAGDWYFYALLLRAGNLSYCRNAKSYFRINSESASRSSFFTEKHINEHSMILQDISNIYGLRKEIVRNHCDNLSRFFPNENPETIFAKTTKHFGLLNSRGEPRICIAAHSFSVGGGEILPVELANKLRSRGVHVSYLVMEHVAAGEPTIRGRLRPDIPVFHWNAVKSDFSSFIQKYKIDVLNSHNVGVDLHLARQKADFDAAWIVSMHGGYETVEHYIDSDFIDYVRHRVDTWWYLTERNKAPLVSKGLTDANFVQSFNAVPTDNVDWEDRNVIRQKLGIPRNGFCIVICSRAIPEKGWDLAIEIAKAASQSLQQDIHICLIGDGPIVEQVRPMAELSSTVHLLGHVENPMKLFRCFDAAVFPTTYVGESFPMFILECFAAGLPVLSTDIGEIPRIMSATALRPGSIVSWKTERAVLVRELTAELIELVRNESLRNSTGKAALETSKIFSIDRLADFYLEHIVSIIERRTYHGLGET